MRIRKLISKEDVQTCVDMYAKHEVADFLPFDREVACKTLFEAARTNRFVRCVEDEGRIIGWIMADVWCLERAASRVILQKYFCTEASPIKAVRVTQTLHLALIDEACRLKIPIIMSTENCFDTKHTYLRILAKEGWKVQGHMAVYKTGFPLTDRPFVAPERPVGDVSERSLYTAHGRYD